MNDPKPNRFPIVFLGIGMLMPLCLVSLSMMLTILLYGERQQAIEAANSTLLLSCLSALTYAVLELIFQRKYPASVLFALSYFLSFSLWIALLFRFVTASDLTVIFDRSAGDAKTVLLAVSFRLCVVHAVALLLRIAYEIFLYIKRLSH